MCLCQPPSGGCVLKPVCDHLLLSIRYQPPSGGCVLKPDRVQQAASMAIPAAFRRLCVETGILAILGNGGRPSRLQAAVC